MLLFHRLNCHSSLPNNSDNIRWSFDLRYNPTHEPTGRTAFPGFVARSRANPETELHDPLAWHRSWLEARANMSTINQGGKIDIPFRRPQTEHPLCA